MDDLDDDDRKYLSKKIKTDEPQVDKNCIAKLMNNTSLSGRELLKCLRIMRETLGRQAFESNLRDYIHERSNMLDNVMKTEIQTFIDSEGEEVDLPLTSVIDLKMAISLLCMKRDIIDESLKILLIEDHIYDYFEKELSNM